MNLPHDIKSLLNGNIPALKSSLPGWRIALNWVCGVDMAEEGEDQVEDSKEIITKSPAEEAKEAAALLHEPEWKRNMVDANAVLVMSVAMFFWGFYA